MSDPQEFILDHGLVPLDHVKEVVHYVEGYNPAKAREYYLRTRQLKGRQPGAAPATTSKAPAAKAPTKIVKKQPPKQSTSTKARVAEMKVRLEKLRKVLRELVKQAKARSGADPKDKKATAGSKKLSAAERKEAAKRSAEYRKKHKSEIENDSVDEQAKRLADQIKDVNAKIAKAKADLKASVAKARTNS